MNRLRLGFHDASEKKTLEIDGKTGTSDKKSARPVLDALHSVPKCCVQNQATCRLQNLALLCTRSRSTQGESAVTCAKTNGESAQQL